MRTSENAKTPLRRRAFIPRDLRTGHAGARSQAHAPHRVTKPGIGSKPGKRRLDRDLDEIGAAFLVSLGQPPPSVLRSSEMVRVRLLSPTTASRHTVLSRTSLLPGHEFGPARKNIRKISVSREDIYLVAALNTNATAARVRAAMRRPTALRPLEDFAHVR
jgi:hypothetical protein